MIALGVVYAYWPGMHIGSPSVHEGRGLLVIVEGLEMGYMMRFVGGEETTRGVAHDLALMRQFANVETRAVVEALP